MAKKRFAITIDGTEYRDIRDARRAVADAWFAYKRGLIAAERQKTIAAAEEGDADAIRAVEKWPDAYKEGA